MSNTAVEMLQSRLKEQTLEVAILRTAVDRQLNRIALYADASDEVHNSTGCRTLQPAILRKTA